MGDVYTLRALIKTKVSHNQFLSIMWTIPLPLTTMQVVDSSNSEKELTLDELRVQHYMSQPQHIAQCSLVTQLVAALVRHTMQNQTLTVKDSYPITQCSRDYGLSYTMLKRVVSGKSQLGGKQYYKMKAGCDKKPHSAIKSGSRRPNLVNQVTSQSSATPAFNCKYCDKVCHTEEGLSNHINNKHCKRQIVK